MDNFFVSNIWSNYLCISDRETRFSLLVFFKQNLRFEDGLEYCPFTKYQPQMGPAQSVLLTKSPANDHPSQKALDKQNISISRILNRQSDFFRKSGFCSNPYTFYLYFNIVWIAYTVKFYSMSKVVHSSTSAERYKSRLRIRWIHV
jgi:hypothetical protein